MSKTKKVTITLTDEQQAKARSLSVLVLGKENISGLIGYIINKLDKEYKSQHLFTTETNKLSKLWNIQKKY